MRNAVAGATVPSVWIASSHGDLCKYLRDLDWPVSSSLGDLLLLTNVRTTTLSFLYAAFHSVALPHPQGAVLSSEELPDALTAANRRDLAIAATYDEPGTLTIWRGDFSQLVVPASTFRTLSRKEKPDTREINIIDYGQTVKLGSYEASVAALLYEFDSDYRRRTARERRKNEKGFGPSLRRLRLQKGLRRADFHPLSEKTIARIERQEVTNIRESTKKAIASRLQVDSSEITSY